MRTSKAPAQALGRRNTLDPRGDVSKFETFHKVCVDVVSTIGSRSLISLVGPGNTLSHFDETDFPGVAGLVALTIDDAPCRHWDPDMSMLKEVRDLLTEYDAKASFFLCTDHVPGHESGLVDLLCDDHEVCNHCPRDIPYASHTEEEFEAALLCAELICEDLRRQAWTRRQPPSMDNSNAETEHRSACPPSCMSFLSAFRREPRRASSRRTTAVSAVPPPMSGSGEIAENPSSSSPSPQTVSRGGQLSTNPWTPSVRWFRAPHARVSATMATVLERQVFVHVLGDAYANDPWISDPSWIAKTLNSLTKSGSVIVIHMPERKFREYNFEALRLFLDHLRNRGLRAVTLSALFDASKLSEAFVSANVVEEGGGLTPHGSELTYMYGIERY